MAYEINPAKCVACGACVGICPVMAISPKDGKFFIDQAKCAKCGRCARMCPMGAIAKSA
jgi:ferredoxin